MRSPAAAIVPLAAMLATGGQASARPTGRAERVSLPPLAIGRHMLERLPVHQEPQDASWRETSYLSVDPFVTTFQDVTVHTLFGIVRTDAGVVAETLWQTDESAGYVRRGNRITLPSAAATHRPAGPVLSLLGGNFGNLYHWTLECIGRLAAADAAALDGCRSVLLPAIAARFQAESLDLLRLDRRWTIEFVRPGDALAIETLVLPSTMTGHHRPHPALHGFFAPMTDAALMGAPAWSAGAWPRLVYIDRRDAPSRRLVNEPALVEALERRGFVPVRLERLGLASQIALFAHAEMVVAPHGAGLTHLLHAAPGCRVIELHMDLWTNWCFRRLAAVRQLPYDCVIGRQLPGPQPEWVHARQWELSLTHVLAAVDQAAAR